MDSAPMTEHPPIPDEAREAACEAACGVVHYQPVFAGVAALEAAAPILWREWTRGMAVVPLPEPDASDDSAVHWSKQRVTATELEGFPIVATSHVDRTPTQARAHAAALLAAADRAEQLAAQHGTGQVTE